MPFIFSLSVVLFLNKRYSKKEDIIPIWERHSTVGPMLWSMRPSVIASGNVCNDNWCNIILILSSLRCFVTKYCACIWDSNQSSRSLIDSMWPWSFPAVWTGNSTAQGCRVHPTGHPTHRRLPQAHRKWSAAYCDVLICFCKSAKYTTQLRLHLQCKIDKRGTVLRWKEWRHSFKKNNELKQTRSLQLQSQICCLS